MPHRRSTVAASASRLRARPEARGRVARHDGPGGITLLIVDDHAGFRTFARALLEAEGLDVVGEAGDGPSALLEATRCHPDLVLLDVVLPGPDGFEVCDRLHDLVPGAAVVLTSSRDASSYVDRLAHSQARGFVTKQDLSAAALLSLLGVTS